MSLDEHSALIEQLKPLLMEPSFAEAFEQLTASESNSTRFLLKMELNRLSAPCTRIIDLRDKSELPCTEVVYGQQRHFLDEPAQQAFEVALALYRDQYTLGVYEQVIEAHKLRKQRLREANNNPQLSTDSEPFIVPGVVLGSYFNRSEERMNYSIRISAQQPGRAEVQGSTIDLSVSGARIRLPARHPFDTDKPLRIKLLELSEEYYYEDLQQGVDYQIVDTQSSPDSTSMRLKRLGGSDALTTMLANLIKGYKYRSKVDVNDILTSATGLGYERHYLPHLPHLPVFIEQKDDQYHPTHMLLSRDNQQLHHYFIDENDISQLSAMLTPARLKRALTQTDTPDHKLFFSFTHVAQGVTFYYSASLFELKQTNTLALFLGFGASKPNWRVFKLTQDKIDHAKRYKASVLPGDDDNYSPLVEQQLSLFSHVIQLMDMTSIEAKSQYQSWFDNSNANALKPFGQEKIKANNIKLISMHFAERRLEARYAFKTQVTVSQGKLKFDAISHDIASRGMQLTVDKETDFDSSKALMLSFPRLQSIAGKTSLTQMPYRLVKSRKNGKCLHIAAVMGHTPHVGVEFLNKLIVHNKDKLEQLTENNNEVKELADGLKNLFMRKLHSIPYFVEKTTKAAQIACLGVGTFNDEITDIFTADTSQNLQYNLTPLLADGVFKEQILEPIKQMKVQQDMDFFEVFIQLSVHSRGKFFLKCVLGSSLTDIQAQQQFIQQSRKLGRFIALRVYRGATGKPDLNYIRREREYINIHANHKAKQLDEQLWRIIGVGELVDITQEVELRYPKLHNAPVG